MRPPAFAAATDPATLLSSLADALNDCERNGLIVDLKAGIAMTSRGYVIPVGDDRLGHRWQARTRLWTPLSPPDDSGDED
jgi:hypothetical protein